MKLALCWRTGRYFKPKQIYYRLYYALRRRLRRLRAYQYRYFVEKEGTDLVLRERMLPVGLCSVSRGTFTFLNISHRFDGPIDWNVMEYGLLWNYHLNSFEYLGQRDVSFQQGLKWMNEFIDSFKNNRRGSDPYPLSRRLVNWIKFIAYHKGRFTGRTLRIIDAFLYAQALILLDNIEYHLMANHLLENGFALLFAAYYFHDQRLYRKAVKILSGELGEQILSDGGHFERSPMYHQLVLHRILDAINLVKHKPIFGEELLNLLTGKALSMLDWLRHMTFGNGNISLFNDSAHGIAYSSRELNDYARRLGLPGKRSRRPLPLGESGYRRVNGLHYEIIIDVGDLGPDYNPGHGHCDTFSFELYAYGKPVVVDTGLSTYDDVLQRTKERMTAAHNTVRVGDVEQSEIWGKFRVGRRAHVRNLKEGDGFLEAEHTGYVHIGAALRRRFLFTDDGVTIHDRVNSKKRYDCDAYLHFYPGLEPSIAGDSILLPSSHLTIKVKNFHAMSLQGGHYAAGFNRLIPNKVLEIGFCSGENLEMEITTG